MRALSAAVLLAVSSACSSERFSEAPDPVPPETQGFYGRSTDGETHGALTPAQSKVCAGDPSVAVVHAAVGSLACVDTSSHGNYMLELPIGPFVLCIGGPTADNVYSCDDCTFTLAPSDKVRRDHMAGPGGGIWFGTPCP